MNNRPHEKATKLASSTAKLGARQMAASALRQTNKQTKKQTNNSIIKNYKLDFTTF